MAARSRRGGRRRQARLAGRAGVAAAAAFASVSMTAITSWPATVEPSPFRISTSTPRPGAGSSSTTLSVSTSIRFSSRATASPGLLVPADERRLGDRLRQLRHLDFDSHEHASASGARRASRRRESCGANASSISLLLALDVLRHVADGGRRGDRSPGVRHDLILGSASSRKYARSRYHAPWFCGSSWHHTTSVAFGNLRERRPEIGMRERVLLLEADDRDVARSCARAGARRARSRPCRGRR